MRDRRDFFLQPLESRRLLSGAAAPHAPTGEPSPADSAHVSPHAVEEQVARLRTALSEMADRMAQFDRLTKTLSSP